VSFLNSLHRGVELVQHPRSEHAEHLVNPLRPGFAEEEHDEVLDLERVGPAQDLKRLRQVLDGGEGEVGEGEDELAKGLEIFLL
jgi:hypothetical protein